MATTAARPEKRARRDAQIAIPPPWVRWGERGSHHEAACSSSQAQLVSRPGGTTQPARTTERSGRSPSRDTSRPCRVPVTSTTGSNSLPSPAVPTWVSTHPHSGATAGALGCHHRQRRPSPATDRCDTCNPGPGRGQAEACPNPSPALRGGPEARDGVSRVDVVGRDGIEPPTLRFSAGCDSFGSVRDGSSALRSP